MKTIDFTIGIPPSAVTGCLSGLVFCALDGNSFCMGTFQIQNSNCMNPLNN